MSELDKRRLMRETCIHCRKPEKDHILVNYADGPFVGAGVLVCPAQVFLSYEKFSKQLRAKL